jgi:hypothetical protein
MALQCSGWQRSGGDGHTGLTVTGKTRSTGRGVGVRISFEGCDVQVVREWAAQVLSLSNMGRRGRKNLHVLDFRSRIFLFIFFIHFAKLYDHFEIYQI